MLNQRPIFINAFARGGSNIIMNMLLSHPKVCLSSGETHKVFKGTKWDPIWRKVKKRLIYDYPIRLLNSQDIFNPYAIEERKDVSDYIKNYIDKILYKGRFDAKIETHNLYKFEGVKYTNEELADCRLLTKGLNGITYTVDMFRQMYPDAVFFGLIRNGLAICEGYIRRKKSAEKIANTYCSVAEKMLQYNEQYDNYYLMRYEDMVKNPLEFIQDIYKKAGLDFEELKKVRLQSKPVVKADGGHELFKGKDRQVFWYELNELHLHIKSDINKNQINRLNEAEKNDFLKIAGNTMTKVGYI